MLPKRPQRSTMTFWWMFQCMLFSKISSIVGNYPCRGKFSQQYDIFICDFLVAVKICQCQLYSLYSNPTNSFRQDAYRELIDLVTCRYNAITLAWVTATLDLNNNAKHFVFKCATFDHPTCAPRCFHDNLQQSQSIMSR